MGSTATIPAVFWFKLVCTAPRSSLRQEVEKLCIELSARRAGKSSKSLTTQKSSATADDFWGAGGSSSQSARSSVARSREAGQLPKTTGQAKGKAKVQRYQKAAAEDFWGGGTTSGAARTVKTTASAAASTSSSRAVASSPAAPSATTRPPAAVVERGCAVSSTSKSPATFSNSAISKAKPNVPALGGSPADSKGSTGTAVGKKSKRQNKGVAAGAGVNKRGGSGSAAAIAVAAKPAADGTDPPGWSGVSCQCMGMKHDVITNCTLCGKIACVVEGGFGCSFCGSVLPVTGREPRGVGGGGSNIAQSEPNGGGVAPQSAALKEALARKDKLLLFDRTSASRTRVLDDQGDYFTSHNWLSQKEREKGEAEEKARRDEAALQRGARRQVKLSIDIMGRRVVEAQGGEGGHVEGNQEAAAAEGISVDLGSTSGCIGVGMGEEDNSIDATKQTTCGRDVGSDQRLSLENTGLRGRAKEVYDVMRANLEKQGVRRVGVKNKKNGKGQAVGKTAPRFAETSRVSLWRVQHDVSSDSLHQSVVDDEIGKLEPRDELPCR